MSEQFEDRLLERPVEVKTPTDVEHVDLLLDLHSSLAQMTRELDRIARELSSGHSRIEDVDLTQANPQQTVQQQEAKFDEAIEVSNPYDVWLEVRASRDGGGPVIMRVPPFSTRLQNARVREISLRALGAPAGLTPATVTRYDRPQVPGTYPLGSGIYGTVLSGAADDGSAPVKVGGVFHNATPVIGDGQRADLLLASDGALITGLSNNGTRLQISQAGDAQSNSSKAAFGIALNEVFNGSTWDRMRGANVFKPIAGLAVVAGTPQAVWTPAAGKKFRLLGFVLGLSVAGAVILKDAGTEVARALVPANGSVPAPEMDNGLVSAAANNALQVDVSAGGNVHGFVYGVEE